MIAILGATGRVGSKVISELLARGNQVKGIARDAVKLEFLKHKGAIVAAGDISDSSFLTNEFKGVNAVLLIIAPNMRATDIAAFQRKTGEAQIMAIKNAGVKNIVFISSLGAHSSPTDSLVSGLSQHEDRLNALPPGVNVISLRPTGFMENLFNQIGMIKNRNIIASPIKANLKSGIIATQDIAAIATDKLAHLDFIGKSSLDLLGPGDYSQKEIAAVIGKAINKPDLKYVEISFEDNKKALMQYGISESVADAMNNMWKNVNDGLSEVIRSPEKTTPTTLSYFAEHDFKSRYIAQCDNDNANQ